MDIGRGVGEGGRGGDGGEEGQRKVKGGGGRGNLVLVSERSPVMASMAVLRRTPLVSPILRKSPPTVPSAPSPSLASPPISTIHRDSGRAGRACILSGCRVSWTDHVIRRQIM